MATRKLFLLPNLFDLRAGQYDGALELREKTKTQMDSDSTLSLSILRDADDEGPLGEAPEGGTRRPHTAILLEGPEVVQVHRRRAEVLQAPDAQLPPGEQSSPGHPPRRLPRPHGTHDHPPSTTPLFLSPQNNTGPVTGGAVPFEF